MSAVSSPTMNALPIDIEPLALAAKLQEPILLQLIDVRDPSEFGGVRISGAKLIPLGELEKRKSEIDRHAPVVLVCRSGRRSGEARERLARSGFSNVVSLSGGLMAWEKAGLPLERDPHAPWSLERQVRVAAGLLVLLGVGLGFFVHPVFLGLSAFVGAGLVFAGVTDWCGMGMLLAKMPWNRRSYSESGGSCCS